MRGQAFVAAAALAAALMGLAQPAAAQQYPTYHDAHVANQQQCAAQRNNNTVGGAVIGGIIGAVLGSNVAANHHRGDGTAVGAVAGAVAGGAIGRGSTNCDEVAQGAYDPYTGQAYNEYPPDDGAYSNDDLAGGPDDDQGYYRDDDRDCRMGQVTTRDPYGRQYTDDVMMCRGDDGVWRPQ